MLQYLLLLAFLVQASFAQTNCGPAQCYSGCTDARPEVDIVFMVDISSSMQPKIQGVQEGFTTFANNLNSKSLSVEFAVVTFGGDSSNSGQSAALVQQFTSDVTTFTNVLAQITNVDGFWEAGMETTRTVLNLASVGNLNLAYRTGSNTRRVYILVTDEDSDPATNTANMYQPSTVRDGLCRGNASLSQATITDITDAQWAEYWQPEINYVFNGLAATNPFLYMFVAGIRTLLETGVPSNQKLDNQQTCNTYLQYCDPDNGIQSQDSDFTNFNSQATYQNLATANYKGRTYQNSLQGQFLNSGRLARCFDVIDCKNPTLIANFFAQIVADVSACNTTCYDYDCSGANCLPPVNQCGCDGVRNSGKVYDSKGNCCLPSAMDCTGICNGGHNYDACGVCTVGGALSPYCLQDCNSNYYLNLPPNPTSISTYAGIIYKTTCPDIGGYLLMNSDVLTSVYVATKSASAVCTQYSVYGRFQGRSYCTFDANAYATQYSVSSADAESTWLASLLTNSPTTASCVPGSQYQFPPLSLDPCKQCIISIDNPPYCVKDCSGVYRTSAAAANFIDNCGYCVAAGSDPNAHKDDCGVCNGTNTEKNQCGQCFGPTGLDGCGQYICKNLTCDTDCDGVKRNPLQKTIDQCGNCVYITQGRASYCIQDCAGVWYNDFNSTSSPDITDPCGNCVPRALGKLPSCKQDCSGTWNGTAYYDNCGQCVINGQTPYVCQQDCNGTWYEVGSSEPYMQIDDCGICNTLADQDSDKDNCGICRNTPGYNSTADCTPDCKGQWLPVNSPNRAFTDFCGDCWFANQTDMRNYLLDNCGVCHKSRSDPTWNQVTSYDDLGNPCPCGVKPHECASGLMICVDYCPTINCTSPDSCNRCPGQPLYGDPRDKCGKCCNWTAPANSSDACNSNVDSCDVCFGYNKERDNPCHICDPWFIYGNSTLCVHDCAGIYGGNTTYGCNGICGSTDSCSNYTAPSNNDTAAIIGGVIGGIVALIALILAVLLAVKYAHTAGLFGNANKQVDFGASNANPLYANQTAVHSNPLYAN